MTLPKGVRDLLGVKPGSVIDFQRTPGGQVVLVNIDNTSRSTRFAGLRGRAGAGLSTDQIMALTRGVDS